MQQQDFKNNEEEKKSSGLFANVYEQVPVDDNFKEESSSGLFANVYEKKETSVDDLDLENFTYKEFKENEDLQNMAVRFAEERLGFENISVDKAIDETIEHFREFNVNELVSASDWRYVSALNNPEDTTISQEKKDRQLNDYGTLYQAFEALPYFGEDSAPDAFVDYAKGILTAPSTALGLVLPGAGKFLGASATATSKLAIGRLINEGLFKQGAKGFLGTGFRANKNLIGSISANPLPTTAVTEGTFALAGDAAAQQALIGSGVQEEYSIGRTVVSVGLASTLPAAGGVFLAKRKGVDKFNAVYAEKHTGDLVKESSDSIKKRVTKAEKEADVVIEKQADVAKTVEEKLKELNQEAVEEGRKTLGKISDEELEQATRGIDRSIRLAVQPEKLKRTTAALTEVLGARGGLRTYIVDGKEQRERITEGIARTLKELETEAKVKGTGIGKYISSEFDDILIKYNLNFDDLANVIMAEVSDSARVLAQASVAKRNLKSHLKNFSSALNQVADYDLFGFDKGLKKAAEKADEAVDANDIDGYLRQTSTLRELDAARLAFMTSQTATTVRNVLSGVTRVTFDILDSAIDRGLRKVTGKQVINAGQNDTLAVLYGITNREQTDAIEQVFALGFENEATRLFRQLQDIADVAPVESKFGNLKNLSRQFNALNTISDNIFKRAALVGNLKRSLNERYSNILRDQDKLGEYFKQFGKMPTEDDFNLVNIIKEGRFNDVFGASQEGRESLVNSIDEALYFTYQREARSAASKLLINAVGKVPFLGTSFMPFPRFVINALQHTLEYSPIYLTYGQGRKQLLNVARPLVGMSRDEAIDSYRDAAKGLVGTAFLSAAVAFRHSSLAGERWYEAKTPDGGTFDLRPFFPAAPFLFFGDIMKSAMSKEDVFKGDRSLVTDAIQALSGTQFRAGMGLYALDKGINDIFTNFDINDIGGSFEPVMKFTTEVAANLVNTATIPLTVVQDTYTTFLAPDDERIARDLESQDLLSLFINKSLSRVPANYAIMKSLEDVGFKNPFTKVDYQAPRAKKPATREGLIRRDIPIARQTFGVLKKERKNAFEKELDRLKLRRSRIYGGRTNIPEYNDLYSQVVDDYVEKEIIPFIKKEGYTKFKNFPYLQRQMLVEHMSRVKRNVNKLIKAQASQEAIRKAYSKDGQLYNPYKHLLFTRLTKTEQDLAKEQYHNDIAPKPTSDELYDYDKLYEIGLQIKRIINKTGKDIAQDAPDFDPTPVEKTPPAAYEN